MGGQGEVFDNNTTAVTVSRRSNICSFMRQQPKGSDREATKGALGTPQSTRLTEIQRNMFVPWQHTGTAAAWRDDLSHSIVVAYRKLAFRHGDCLFCMRARGQIECQ
jgi:hypothetical protein